jgi:carbon storage regulator
VLPFQHTDRRRTAFITAVFARNTGRGRPLTGSTAPDRSGTKGTTTMLVLSRHRDESIIINDNIVVTIVDIRGDKVRLGIQAPSNIPVHRQEIYDAIQREKSRDPGTPPSSGGV